MSLCLKKTNKCICYMLDVILCCDVLCCACVNDVKSFFRVVSMVCELFVDDVSMLDDVEYVFV